MKLFPLRLLPTNIAFDFMRLRKVNYAISVLLVLISIISLFIFKLNFGIDFTGGISIDARINQSPDLAKMREVLSDLHIGEVMLQTFGKENDVSIRVGLKEVVSSEDLMKNVDLIKITLNSHFPYDIDYRQVDFVGPQVGSALVVSGTKAIVLAFLAIMIYIWVRFEWQFGCGVLIALIHDSIMCIGFMSITQLDFNLSSIAALLTIIGYSVNDSVVIYDRIRENVRKYRQKSTYDIINLSLNETLSRTTLTVLTVLLSNLALIIWGGEALKSFSVMVFFGIVAGTYSSIFVSAPILTLFNIEKFR